MVDSTHLLSHPKSSIPIVHHQDYDEHNLSSLSSTIDKCIGDQLNWTQSLHALLISFSWFSDGQQTFITIFTYAQPSWHCTDDACNSTTNLCTFPRTHGLGMGPRKPPSSQNLGWIVKAPSSWAFQPPRSSRGAGNYFLYPMLLLAPPII